MASYTKTLGTMVKIIVFLYIHTYIYTICDISDVYIYIYIYSFTILIYIYVYIYTHVHLLIVGDAGFLSSTVLAIAQPIGRRKQRPRSLEYWSP